MASRGGRVIRALYSLAMWLAQPLLRRKLMRRGRVEAGYLEAMNERFGHYVPLRSRTTPSATPLAARPDGGYIWIHAVSLGETRGAAVLIGRLREYLPGMRLLLTHGTATGRAEGRNLLREGDVQAWQPWDAPGAVQRFIRHFKPRIGILMETEVWPNLAAVCHQQGVPLVLANARLSDKSLRQSLRLGWLSKPAYQSLMAVWAQTQADAQRLRVLGAPVRGVFGNIKFDAAPDAALLARGQAWRAQWGQLASGGVQTRRVVMFASSREGEEAQLLACLEQDAKRNLEQNKALALESSAQSATKNIASDIQWLIVPRHPQRFDEVAALIAQHGFSVSRRSGWGDAPPPSPPAAAGTGMNSSIWLGDSLGEMALYYGLADMVLLGGSFEPLGGQNLIEAAACGCPVIMGPHTFNFAQAAELAEAADVARRVPTLAQAVSLVGAWANDPAALAARRAATVSFTAAHRGAADQTVQALVALVALISPGAR
jgi:3-deoxy-D-manno-octulosonic-acid transferase